jgi:hypothetical protein
MREATTKAMPGRIVEERARALSASLAVDDVPTLPYTSLLGLASPAPPQTLPWS